jgi:hypothetical protein
MRNGPYEIEKIINVANDWQAIPVLAGQQAKLSRQRLYWIAWRSCPMVTVSSKPGNAWITGNPWSKKSKLNTVNYWCLGRHLRALPRPN